MRHFLLVMLVVGCGDEDTAQTDEGSGEGESESESEALGCDCDPRECFYATCVEEDRSCRYTPIPHLLCDDEDPCTEDDQCDEAGACAGDVYECEPPPVPACADAATLRGYADGACDGDGGCDYDPIDAECAAACVDAACCAFTVESETIADATGRPALALDAAGSPRVAYQASGGATQLLRYGTRNAGGWGAEIVAGDNDSEFAPSLAVSTDNVPHVLYRLDGAIHYSRRGIGSWSTVAVGAGADRGAPSLLISGNTLEAIYDQPGVGDCRSIVRATRSAAGTWSEQTADACGAAPSLALGPDGTLHAAYVDEGLRYARLGAGAAAWMYLRIVEDEEVASVAVAAGPDGRVHVVWVQEGEVRYAVGTLGTGFSIETVAAGAAPDVAVGADGGVHVVHDGSGEILYARRGGEEVWPSRALAAFTTASAGATVVADAAGTAHAAWTADGEAAYATVTMACE